ncbi:rhodopsin-like [Eriocheir sinensis]|uniref:rhodopsin-like n=1 Tax=Eriocheir sinensis TaxID=95602 RepID=UPI0021C5E7E6|nr:rhodopsin-like [Eriocheir sinensis]
MLRDLFESVLGSDQRWLEGDDEAIVTNVSLVSRVPADVQHKVHRHWQQFEVPHPLWHTVLGMFYLLIGAAGLMGNGLVLWIFSTSKSLRGGTNVLVMNLALTDLLMMGSQAPVLVVNCFTHRWTLGPTACEIYGFCGALFGTVSITTLALIALDRYKAIVKPYTGWRLSCGRGAAWACGSWAYGAAWCCPPLLGWNQYVLEGFLTSCTFDYLTEEPLSRVYVMLLFVFAYVVPLGVITTCYCFIYVFVSRHDHLLLKENVLTRRTCLTLHRRETQLARVVVTSVLFWTLAWTPYAVVSLLGALSWRSHLTPLSTMLPAVFAKLSTVYNPFIYAVSHPTYRQELARRLPGVCCKLGLVKGGAAGAETEFSRHYSLSSITSRCEMLSSHTSSGDSALRGVRRERQQPPRRSTRRQTLEPTSTRNTDL